MHCLKKDLKVTYFKTILKEEVDTDGDGVIQFEEFYKMWIARNTE